MASWYQNDLDQVVEILKTDLTAGLDEDEAKRRLAEYGENELKEGQGRTPWQILWEQLTATMVLILLAAALISGLLGDFKDAIAIGAIVILFALLGFIQDYRAEQAMAALKKMAMPLVRVVRGGILRELLSSQLVPGDLIQLEAGNLVPADVRIASSFNLRIQESALTGESEPVEKETRAYPDLELPLGDRRNMGYMGTQATYGRGSGIVVETGMRSELGRIAGMLQEVRTDQTPLQRRLDQLGKLLALVGLGVAGLIFIFGLLRNEPVRDLLLTSVSVAVAIVPEGLPAVVTITLALGAQRMLKRNALIRRLSAVETLGSVTVICSDKTGTLTENRMTVAVLDIAGHRIDLTESMYHRMPSLDAPGTEEIPAPPLPGGVNNNSLGMLLIGGALANDASLVLRLPETADRKGAYQTIGDPTEGALLVAAAQYGLLKEELQELLPRVTEIPFDSERKRMSTLHKVDYARLAGTKVMEMGLFLGDQLVGDQLGGNQLGGNQLCRDDGDTRPLILLTKGSVDGLLEISNQVWVDGCSQPLDHGWRDRIQSANDRLAAQGMRVLGMAFRRLGELPEAEAIPALEQDLTIVGLFGMIDPPRAEVRQAVQTSKSAGVRPVMITGDHPLTAREIARQLGIIDGDVARARVVTGQELEGMTDDGLSAIVDQVSVYARVSPEHKLRIVQALQSRGQIVAMTGDGVNDAPALKRADIGVAMGITGTDVSKEASEMVLQDDNFATIVSAIEEGRTIYDNLRKFIAFSVAGNIGKALVMLLAPFLSKPLPLQPLQLLWLNLLTDGLLGLGMGLEPPERDTMTRPPYSPKVGVFSGGLLARVIWVGVLIGAIGLGVGYYYWRMDPNGNWQTMTFTTLALAQIAQAFASRSLRESFFSLGLRTNITLFLLAVAVFGLQMVVVYVPVFQTIFYTEPLTIGQLLVSLLLSSLVFVAIEIEKWLLRRRDSQG